VEDAARIAARNQARDLGDAEKQIDKRIESHARKIAAGKATRHRIVLGAGKK
jgi:hypothetical protein